MNTAFFRTTPGDTTTNRTRSSRWRFTRYASCVGIVLAVIWPTAARSQVPPKPTAGTVFVDDQWGDDLTGTREQSGNPVKTIRKAFEIAQTGDTIVVRRGTYYITGELHSNLSNLTIEGMGNPTIKKTSQSGQMLILTGSNVTVRGLTLDGSYGGGSGNAYDHMLVSFGPSASKIEVTNCRFVHNLGSAVRIYNQVDDVTIKECHFGNNYADIWVHAYPGTSTGPRRVKVLENTFNGNHSSGVGTAAVKISVDGSVPSYHSQHVVANNTIRGPGEMGIEIWGNHKGDLVSANNIEGTAFGISVGAGAAVHTDSGQHLIVGNETRNNAFCGVELAANTSENLVIGTLIDGRKEDGTLGMTNPYGGAYALSENARNNTIMGGSIQDCPRAATFFNNCHDNTVRNLRYRPIANAWGFHVLNSDNVKFYDIKIDPPVLGGTALHKLFYLHSTGTTSGLVIEGITSTADIDQHFAWFDGGSWANTRIERNVVNDANNFINSGFIGFANGTTAPGLVLRDNAPSLNLSSSGQYGFHNNDVNVSPLRLGNDSPGNVQPVVMELAPWGGRPAGAPVQIVAIDDLNYSGFLSVRIAPPGSPWTTPVEEARIDAGGISLPTGNSYRINGIQVVGARGAAVQDATDAASTTARLNDLLARLRAHGLIAP